MKQLIKLCLFFFLHTNFIFAEPVLIKSQEQQSDQSTLKIYTTLRVIKKMHRDVENQFNHLLPEEQSSEKDCMIEIITILVSTYEKIIETTVSHYLMVNMLEKQNLQNQIANIIAEDMLKIMRILGKELFSFVFNKEMTWQQKLWYCTWISAVIIIMKIGVDQMPKYEIQEDFLHQVSVQDGNFEKNRDDESVYLQGKFNNWK